MILSLCLLSAMPCFSSVIASPWAQSLVYGREVSTGYLVHGSLSSSWGGEGQLVTYLLDESGIVEFSSTASFEGEPVSSDDLSGGSAVLCIDNDNAAATLAYIDETAVEQWSSVFFGEFDGTAAIRVSDLGILLAGHDNQTPLVPRIALLSHGGVGIWNNTYESISAEIRDVCSFNDQIFVLATTELPGWESDICLIVLDGSGEYQSIQHILPEPGRFSPRDIEIDSTGIYVLANAMTNQNGMIYETNLIHLNFSFGIEWVGSVSGSSWSRGTQMIPLESGRFAVCGWTNCLPPSDQNRSDLVLCKFDSNGVLMWNRTIGTVSTDYGLSLASASDGGFVATGCVTEDLYQGWVLKTDSLGLLEPQGFDPQQQSALSVRVMRNPSLSGILQLETVSPESVRLEISVFDMAGRRMDELSVTIPAGQSVVNMSRELPAGVYIVTVSGNGQQAACKTVVFGKS